MDAFAFYETVLTPTEIDNSACTSTLSTSQFELDSTAIYPNPFDNIINVEFQNQKDNLEVELIDILGKTIISEEYNNVQSIRISAEQLTQGIYFLRIKSDNQSITRKVIKR